jgi:hypothetical protein
MLPTSTSDQDGPLSFHHGGFNWVETPNGGLLAVHPNGEGVEWVETPSGGLLAFPKRRVQSAWTPSAIPEHLDSARYWGAAPSPSGQMWERESHLSPVPQAPTRDQVPTTGRTIADAVVANPRNPQVLGDTATLQSESNANDHVASSFAELVDPFAAAAARTRKSVQPEGGRREGMATRVAQNVGKDIGAAALNLATLPQRALHAADVYERGGDYDPAPIVEAATLMIGAPLAPKGALGSAARRPGRPARLPMDEASRIERADAMGFRRDMPLEYGRAPEGEKIAAAAIDVNGRIFTGRNHSEAITRAERELGMHFDRMTQAPIVDGFVTNGGRYVSRWEADDIARRASQGRATGDFGATHGLGSETVEMAVPGAVPRSSVRTAATAPGLPGGHGFWGMVVPEGATSRSALWSRAERPFALDARGLSAQEIQARLQTAWDRGHDAMLLGNYTRPGGKAAETVFVVRDLNQLRSQKARFDPAKRNSANLLASGAGAALVGPTLTDIFGER